MSPTDHTHEWVEGPGYPDLRCAACGASHSAIQTTIGEAAVDARRVGGEAHYTGCHVHQESETLELEGMRPDVYVIHNDSPHPLGELLAVRRGSR